MILKSLNKLDPKFGYPDEIQYENPNFHGHQKGVCIALKNDVTNEIEQNFISESLKDKDALLEELLSMNDVLLVEDHITQFDEHSNLVPKTLFYLPYAVKEHSIFKPTLNDVNVETESCNVTNRFEVEILFVKEGLNRYMVIPYETRNISVFDSMLHTFDGIFFCDHFGEDHELYQAGVRWEEEGEDHEEGFYLDFYNEVGQAFNLGFSDMSSLRDTIASIRLLSHVLIIDKDGE